MMQSGISRRKLIGGLGLGGAAAWAMPASAEEKTAEGAAGVPVFNVRDFGAVADGRTMNTPAFQKAIDVCAAAGGGTVYFPSGRYLTGGMILKSHVTLQFATGAVLIGSTRLEDYPEERPTLASRSHIYVQHALIYGENLECIAIRGPGVLDGQGAEFRKMYRAAFRKRPYLIRLIGCRDVYIEDVMLTQSAMWALLMVACDRVRVRGVGVWSHVAANNDGFDIDACQDVVNSDCIIDSGDDAICLKSTYDRPCRNVAVTNCVLASHTNAFKLGTESLGGFQNIALSNCLIHQSADTSRGGPLRGYSGVSLQMVDGGLLEHVVISNLVIEGVEVGIFLRLSDRGAKVAETDPKPKVGTLSGVSISHVIGKNIGQMGCVITGIPEHCLQDVTMEDIRLTVEGGGTREDAQRANVPELVEDYPEATMFGMLPAYGFYVRHARNLRLRNMDLGYSKSDRRPPVVLEDIDRLELAGLAAQNSSPAEPLLRLRNVRDAWIHGCRLNGSEKQAAEIDAACRNIRWMANDFSVPETGS